MNAEVQRALRRAGVSGLSKPKLTPDHPTKKGVVVVLLPSGKPKTIRFGDQSMGHNYSAAARRAFRARHAKNIAKGPTSAAYWSNKVLWRPGGPKKDPPKTQKRVFR